MRGGRAEALRPRLVDDRGRVALPKSVRLALKVGAGAYVAFAVQDGAVVITRVDWRSAEDL